MAATGTTTIHHSKMFFKRLLVRRLLFLFLGFAIGIGEASHVWQTAVNGLVLQGNGVFLTPNVEHLIVTTSTGVVTSLDPYLGTFQWEFLPPMPNGSDISSDSGISFSPPGSASQYMVYAFTENADIPQSRVVALAFDGTELWMSPPIVGESAGTPKISSDGENIFLNLNLVDSFGRFVVLSRASNGAVIHNEVIESCPLVPLGIFYNPAEGYYSGGGGNTNDLVMWSCTAVAPFVGFGGLYAFQFPIASNAMAMSEFLGDLPGEFWGISSPAITNDGRSAYWGSSSSRYIAWVGADNDPSNRFDRNPSFITQFERSTFPSQPIFNTPALNSNPSEPIIYGGTASTQFVRCTHDFSDIIVVETQSNVVAKAIVAPSDDIVYYVESNGIVHEADASDLTDIGTINTGASTVLGEIALDSSGLFLFVADFVGTVRAYEVNGPSSQPSPAPSVTLQPSGSPTDRPTTPPTSAPSNSPTGISDPVLLGNFMTRNHLVAGEVYLISERIMEIRNFVYDGLSPQAYFWIDTNPSPSQSGRILADASPSLGCATTSADPDLPSANGITQRVEFPPDTSIQDYWGGSFSVWSDVFNVNLGELVLPTMIDQIPVPLPGDEVLECFETPSHAPSVSPAPSEAPTEACKDYGATCEWYYECCTERCVFNVCQKVSVTPKVKVADGRGGAAGASTRTVRGTPSGGGGSSSSTSGGTSTIAGNPKRGRDVDGTRNLRQLKEIETL